VTYVLAASADERSFYHHAAVSPWVLGVVFAAAIVLVFWLYHAQQRIASRRLIGTLTVIRLLLLLCVAVLLVQPAVRWVHRRSSAGTLWLMLDGTGSMASTDPQSTPIERLRWAEALGYLPADRRPAVQLDRTVAELACLRDDLARLRALAGLKTPDAAERFGEAMKAWRGALEQATAQLASHAKTIPAVSVFVANLGETAKVAESPSEATWGRLEADFDVAVRTLGPLADSADGDFLKSHANDPAVAEAMAKVAKLSRSQLAQLALAQGLREQLPAYRVRIASFADKVQATTYVEAAELDEAIKRSLVTSGQSTSLAAGLSWIAEQTSPDEPTSVLVISDGRQNLPGDAAAAAQQLGVQGAHVCALAIGSSQIAVDAAVEAIDAPDWVYKDDAVRASARVRADGLGGKPIDVEFWRDGNKIDGKKITPGKPQQLDVLSFEDRRPELGVHDYEIRIPEMAGEENKENNRQGCRVAVKKDQLKMLVVEDQARWEYRHMVSYLSRDPRVKLQTVLFGPARIQDVSSPTPVAASPTNSRVEAQMLPQTAEQWQAFDVIVLGDVAGGDLRPEQQKNLAAAVKDGGKTLIVIAGARNMPVGYSNAPLADVLPVTLASDWSPETLAEHLRLGFRARVTPEGSASILSQFRLDPSENATAWGAAPAWYWHAEQTQAKPSATVLWSIADAEGATQPNFDGPDSGRRRGLLVVGSYGAGRVMYLASDQTWRLRQINGENLQERFWGQVVRWASGDDLPAGGQFARFGADKPRYGEAEPVVVTVRLVKEDLTPLAGQAVEIVASSSAATTQPSERRTLAQAKLVEVPEAPGLYRAALTGLPPGSIDLSLRGVDRLLADVTDEKQRTLQVRIQPHLTVEQRDTNTDKPHLAAISKAGGGISLDGPYAAVLARHIPQPKLEQTSIEQLGFFGDPKSRYTRLTHWIFLAAFCVLITAEWVIRKAGGLV
jgi:hypothetical protein